MYVMGINDCAAIVPPHLLLLSCGRSEPERAGATRKTEVSLPGPRIRSGKYFKKNLMEQDPTKAH